MSKTRRILALAVASALIGGGGVALAAANGNSKSQAPQKAKTSKPAQHRQTVQHSHGLCPNQGSNSDTAFASDL